MIINPITLLIWIKNMNKVFVDTDVILDLLAGRLPNFHFSAVLFTFAEMKIFICEKNVGGFSY